MPGRPVHVLCLDIEGGHGGSSRSLYESIAHLDRTETEVSVWCKREGPIQDKYRALDVSTVVRPDMPKVSSLPRLSRNLYAYGLFVRDWLRAGGFRNAFLDASRDADVVHFNHESLFLLARWMKPRTRAMLSMHIRTNLYGTRFCRWQDRTIAQTLDHLVYITENEASTMRDLSGLNPAGTVIYNIVELSDAPPHPAVSTDSRFKIACLSNYAWVRGIDRTVEIAAALRDAGRDDVLFVMAGDMHLSRSLPGELGKLGAAGKTLEAHVQEQGLSNMFLFLGHVGNPESVLASCDALIKPTREENPWGRDILEGLAAGKAAISIGYYDRFVEDGVTGILLNDYNCDEMARRIAELADDRARCRAYGENGRNRVRELCDGEAKARELAGVWHELAGRG
ncbi:MAG: glycosyltransferase family 4 protein [Proteobacteria bacterium]|nr:glycosyltransferase family 4 protein [Pseudomonadota bacterium]